MATFNNYRRYRQLQIRNAWMLAGMDQVVLPVLRGAFIAAILLLAYGVVNHRVEAGQQDTDNRIKSATSGQAAYVKGLEAILARCLSGGDKPITIGNEIWFCSATTIGEKIK
jgi:hypothetical protein